LFGLLPRFFSLCCLFSLETLRVDSMSMVSDPGTTNEGTHFLGIPLFSPYVGHVGPPYISTLTLPEFTIGLPV